MAATAATAAAATTTATSSAATTTATTTTTTTTTVDFHVACLASLESVLHRCPEHGVVSARVVGLTLLGVNAYAPLDRCVLAERFRQRRFDLGPQRLRVTVVAQDMMRQRALLVKWPLSPLATLQFGR